MTTNQSIYLYVGALTAMHISQLVHCVQHVKRVIYGLSIAMNRISKLCHTYNAYIPPAFDHAMTCIHKTYICNVVVVTGS